jgi:hypothetical protein
MRLDFESFEFRFEKRKKNNFRKWCLFQKTAKFELRHGGAAGRPPRRKFIARRRISPWAALVL